MPITALTATRHRRAQTKQLEPLQTLSILTFHKASLNTEDRAEAEIAFQRGRAMHFHVHGKILPQESLDE